MNIGLERYRYYYYSVRSSALFQDLPDKGIRQLLSYAQWHLHPKKQLIWDTEKPPRKFYIILKGKIKVFGYDPVSDRNYTFKILKKHDVFDIFSILGKVTLSLRYKTLKETELLEIEMHKMRKWLENYPEFSRALVPYLLHQMSRLEENLMDLAVRDTDFRLAKLLLRHSDEPSGQLTLISDLSHSELAALIGTTRPVLNRHIRKLVKKGVITFDKRELKISNRQLLQDLIRSRMTSLAG